MVLILIDTRSFSFMATGHTEDEARMALAQGWAIHARETGADPRHVNAEEDGNVFALEPGECWRDDARIWKA